MPTKKKSAVKAALPTAGAVLLSGEERFERVNPNVLMLGQNVRFKLTRDGIDKMKADILSIGKVETPIVVEELSDEDKATNPGKLYRVVKGNYRTTAAQELNAKDGAGLDVPVTVTSFDTLLQRITRQVAENVVREQMNPMDEAIAIKLLLDNGATKQEVMTLFSRSTGTRNKAGKMVTSLEPASNSFINMRLSFLDLPKVAQNAIADGKLGVKGGYELTKYEGEELKKTLDVLVEKWEKEEDAARAAEEKLLKSERKDEEAKQKADEIAKKVEEAKLMVDNLEKEAATVTEVYQAAFNAKVAIVGSKDKKDEQKKVEEAFKAAENNDKAIKTNLAKAKEVLTKALKAALPKAVTPPAAPTPATGQAGVAEAARTAGATPAATSTRARGRGQGTTTTELAGEPQHVPLNAAQMRQYVESIIKLAFANQPKTKLIGEYFQKAFAGEGTDGTLYKDIAVLMGEWKK